jgi:hypothetical protein
MIVTVRSNVGAKRIVCPEDATLHDLKVLTKTAFSISVSDIGCEVSFDRFGNEILTGDQSNVKDLGIKNLTVVYLLGKYELKTVDKSFVNEDGTVVPVGTSMRCTEPFQRSVNTAESTETAVTPHAGLVVPKPVPVRVPIHEASASAAAEGNAFDPSWYSFDDEADAAPDSLGTNSNNIDSSKSDIRAPDVVQSMTLLPANGNGSGASHLLTLHEEVGRCSVV